MPFGFGDALGYVGPVLHELDNIKRLIRRVTTDIPEQPIADEIQDIIAEAREIAFRISPEFERKTLQKWADVLNRKGWRTADQEAPPQRDRPPADPKVEKAATKIREEVKDLWGDGPIPG